MLPSMLTLKCWIDASLSPSLVQDSNSISFEPAMIQPEPLLGFVATEKTSSKQFLDHSEGVFSNHIADKISSQRLYFDEGLFSTDLIWQHQ